MRAYSRLGQRNAALEWYRRCREVVGEELGTEPMADTTELYRAILEGRFETGRAVQVVPTPVLALAPPVSPGRSPLDALAPSRLVGREQELAFLDECRGGVEAGPGRLVLVSGEAGVGKTRLVEELAHHLRWRGTRVLWGRCYEFERVLPYQPVAKALRTILPTLTADELGDFPSWTVAAVGRLAPEVLEKLAPSDVEGQPGLEVGAAPSLEQERTRLFEELVRFLAGLSCHGPLLVVLEDLHWASESTL